MRWRRVLFLVGVLGGVCMGSVACAPSSSVCMHARIAHVHVNGCPR